MQPARSRRPAVPLVLAAAAAMLAVAAGISTASDDVKPFAASITASPDASADAGAQAWAGAVPSVTIRITNGAREQRIGSADITIPTGIALAPGAPVVQSPAGTTAPAVAGGVIRLRNLALKPGRSVDVTVSARIPCTPANPYTWTTRVKQSNDFNGTGNDFAISTPQPSLRADGACSLAFPADGQPASAQRGSVITNETYLPSGRPVRVVVLDGSGAAPVTWWTAPVTLALGANPAGGTLTGTLTATPSSGAAAFAPVLDRSAGGYRLTASSPGITAPAPLSAAFTTVDSGQRCTAGTTCTGSSSKATTSATVSTANAATGDLLTVSLGAPDAPALDCPDYVESGETLAFDVTSSTGGPSSATKTVVYQIASPTRSATKYQVCFRSPSPFTTRAGLPAPLQGGAYVGLLPDCSSRKDDDHRTTRTAVPPCVSARSGGSYGTPVKLTVLAPPGDPWIKG